MKYANKEDALLGALASPKGKSILKVIITKEGGFIQAFEVENSQSNVTATYLNRWTKYGVMRKRKEGRFAFFGFASDELKQMALPFLK